MFFAIECGNRYLNKNTVKLDEQAPDGPRADIAAIVLAASIADVVVNLFLHSSETLTVQGNLYGMASPVFELSLYAGLGLISGLISVIFTKLREIFTELFNGAPPIACLSTATYLLTCQGKRGAIIYHFTGYLLICDHC